MNITLRKANALQLSIQDLIKSIIIESEIVLNEFQNAEQELNKANASLIKKINRKLKLIEIQYSIRNKIGKANAESGIDELLTLAAHVDKQTTFIDSLSKLKAATDISIINGFLEKIKNRDSGLVYGQKDTVSASVLTEDQISEYQLVLSKLRRNKQRINDQILDLNIKTSIVLDTNETDILLQEDLL